MFHVYFVHNARGIARAFYTRLRPPRLAKRAGEYLPAFQARGAVCVCLLLASCATLPGEREDGKGEIDGDPQIVTLKQKSDQYPADARAHYELGNALYDAARYLEAIAAYAQAIESDPKFADAYTNLGLSHRQLNNRALAVENYEISLALQPDDSATLRNMIIVLRARGMPERALGYLLRLVRLHPQDSATRSDLAASLFALGRYQEASEHYRFLLELEAADLNQRFNLGFCYYIADDWDRALDAWTPIVEQNINHGPTHRGMAMAYMKKGDYDSAWKSVGECERIGFPLSVEFLSDLRNVSRRLGPH